MSKRTTFRIVTIPKLRKDTKPDSESNELAEKFRELRLRSLKVAPDSFASRFADESRHTLDHTLDRLSTPKAVHFVATKEPNARRLSFDGQTDVQRMLQADWLGLIVLLGPQDTHNIDHSSGDPFQRMTAARREDVMLSGDNSESASSLHFHLNAMFVDPSARGGGLGLALIDAAVGRAEAEAAKLNASLKITITVYDHVSRS